MTTPKTAADYHCCATCEHFSIRKTDGKTAYACARLGYDTRPTHQFNCWSPNPNVRKLLNLP